MTHRRAAFAAMLWLAAAPAHAQTDTPTRADDDAPEPSTPARFETGLEGRPARPAAGERVDFNLEDGDLMDLIRMMTLPSPATASSSPATSAGCDRRCGRPDYAR
ncbi:MAG: hypothetical protein R3B82_25725 [Sandaracinaceae bacterium]